MATVIHWPAIVVRGVLFAALWWGLTEGEPSSWIVGVPVVAAAIAASFALRVAPGWRWRTAAVPGFVGGFLRDSLWAGVDVAVRAITLDISPRLADYQISLKHRAARLFFASIVSLLPGTLTVALQGNMFRVHCLNDRQPVADDLRRLELRVARLFGDGGVADAKTEES